MSAPDVSAPAREPPPAPGSAAAPAPPSAPIAQPARAAVGEEDHRFGLVVLAAALLIIAGPLLGITRLLSVLIIRAERRCALRASNAPAPAGSTDLSAVIVGESEDFA